MQKIELHPLRDENNQKILYNQFSITEPNLIFGNYEWILFNLIKGDPLFPNCEMPPKGASADRILAFRMLEIEEEYLPIQECPHSDLIIKAGEIAGIRAADFYHEIVHNKKNRRLHFCGIWKPFAYPKHQCHEYSPDEPVAACMCRTMLGVLLQIHEGYTASTPPHIFPPDLDSMPSIDTKILASACKNPKQLRELANELEKVQENQRVMNTLLQQEGVRHSPQDLGFRQDVRSRAVQYLEQLIRDIASFVPNPNGIILTGGNELPKKFHPEKYEVCNRVPDPEILIQKAEAHKAP